MLLQPRLVLVKEAQVLNKPLHRGFDPLTSRMNETIEKLKKVGYPFGKYFCSFKQHDEATICEACQSVMPPLEELIENCGERFGHLYRNEKNSWTAHPTDVEGEEYSHTRHAGDPRTAVAEMYISLNTKHE